MAMQLFQLKGRERTNLGVSVRSSISGNHLCLNVCPWSSNWHAQPQQNDNKVMQRINRPTRVLNNTRSYHSRCAVSTADQPIRQLQRNGRAQPTCHRQLRCGRDLNLLSFSFILAPPSLQCSPTTQLKAARLSTEGTQQVLTLHKAVGKYAVGVQ